MLRKRIDRRETHLPMSSARLLERLDRQALSQLSGADRDLLKQTPNGSGRSRTSSSEFRAAESRYLGVFGTVLQEVTDQELAGLITKVESERRQQVRDRGTRLRYGSVFHRRLSKLETIVGSSKTPPILLRVVISASGKELNLQTSTCQRIVNGNGTVTELVTLDGSRQDITDEELDRFVAGVLCSTQTPGSKLSYR